MGRQNSLVVITNRDEVKMAFERYQRYVNKLEGIIVDLLEVYSVSDFKKLIGNLRKELKNFSRSLPNKILFISTSMPNDCFVKVPFSINVLQPCEKLTLKESLIKIYLFLQIKGTDPHHPYEISRDFFETFNYVKKENRKVEWNEDRHLAIIKNISVFKEKIEGNIESKSIRGLLKKFNEPVTEQNADEIKNYIVEILQEIEKEELWRAIKSVFL